MKIDIIGAGSLGLLFAGRLIRAGNAVRIWCRGEEQVKELKDRGLTIGYEDGRTPLFIEGKSVEAVAVQEFAEHYRQQPGDWIIITVKQNVLHHTLPQQLVALQGERPNIVCFQNGSGHMELLEELLPDSRLYAAVTTEAAKRRSSTEVIHTGQGGIWIGEWNRLRTAGEGSVGNSGTDGRAISFVEELNVAGFSALLSNEVDTMIYRKLLINAIINPLTAIWRIQNGELLQSGRRMQLMRELYEEAIAVYDACNIAYDEDAWENILRVCRDTAGNTSSMLADVAAGRSTEIKWINGRIVEMAERVGKAVPLHGLVSRLVESMIAEER